MHVGGTSLDFRTMRSLEGQVLELIPDGKGLHHGLCIGEKSDKGKKFVGRFVETFFKNKRFQFTRVLTFTLAWRVFPVKQ